jgi:hypothetical protein
MNIKFSHRYPKLHGQKSARLLCVELRNRAELNEEFVEYDTVYENDPATDHYCLTNGRYMVLVFLGNKLIPFTTVRRWTAEKERYYKNAIGGMFEIEYVEEMK